MPSPICALVVGGDLPLGTQIGEALAPTAAVVVSRPGRGALRDDAVATVETAITEMGRLDLLVVCGWNESAVSPVACEDMDDAMFDSIWESGMQTMLWPLQAAIPALRESSGSVVIIIPTTAMSGGAMYAAAAATFEAQRVLMKSASRQLASAGIRVNAIAVGPEHVLDDPGAAQVHYLSPSPEQQPSGADVAAVIEFLASAAGRHLTGQTITMDGGRWLAP